MTYINHDGRVTLAALWSLTFLTLIFVALRLFTRLIHVPSSPSSRLGWDDHFFNVSFLSLLIYTILITLSARSGFGHNYADLSSRSEDIHGRLLVDPAQTLLVFATIFAKLSLALFLRRISGDGLRFRWAIWLPISGLALLSTAAIIALWVSCHPFAYAWDLGIPEGSCNILLQGVFSLVAGIWDACTNLWYAAFPWYLLWGLRQMPRDEKILIGTGLSFGFVAALCGILRTVHLAELENNENYLKQIVPLVQWHGAEMAVTLISIGIAVCRPLYKRQLKQVSEVVSKCRRKFFSRGSRRSEGMGSKNTTGTTGTLPSFVDRENRFDVIALRTVGGTEYNNAGQGRGGRRGSSTLQELETIHDVERTGTAGTEGRALVAGSSRGGDSCATARERDARDEEAGDGMGKELSHVETAV